MTGAAAITVAVVRAGVCLSEGGEYTLIVGIPDRAPIFFEVPLDFADAWLLTARIGLPVNAEPLEEPAP